MSVDVGNQAEAAATELKGLYPDELETVARDVGLEAYRGQQVAQWLYGRGTRSFDEMTNLSKEARQSLSERATILTLEAVATDKASDGQATKFLFDLPDGRRVESVLMREGKRRTVCVSSQVGCPLDCTFCATGRMGLLRNLGAAEIIDQVLYARRILNAQGEELTNVVMMGMGEPLLNLDAVSRAIRLMNLNYGPAISRRRITISTAGHVVGIRKLAASGPRVMLAVSLNATDDALRDEIMPINRRWPIAELLDAVSEYQRAFGRYVTIEYVLLGGLNDSVSHAHNLVDLVAKLPCKINVIPWNPVENDAFSPPSSGAIEAFVETIASRKMTATVRYSKGTEIAAGCGQLHHAHTETS